MKLVDILARELKAWPEGLECLSQLKGTGYIINGTGFDGRAFDALQIADETLVAGAIVTRAEWQAAVDALNAPKAVEWDEDGLPPVGLDVEVMQGGLPSVAFDWEACKILAINIGSDEKPQVITRDFRGDAAIYYPGIDSVYFRPARTTEQVADEEREKAINEMVFGVCGCEPDGGNTTAFMICGFIYDAGYRKQVAP